MGLLIGRQAIAEYCGVWPGTVDNWRKRHGFPFCHMPNGRVATSADLIDKWILERFNLQEEARARYRAEKDALQEDLPDPGETAKAADLGSPP